MTFPGQLDRLSESGAFHEISDQFTPGEEAIYASKPTSGPEVLRSFGMFLMVCAISLFVLAIPFFIFFITGLLSQGICAVWYIWIGLLPLGAIPVVFGIMTIVRFFKALTGFSGSMYVATNKRIITRSGGFGRAFLDAKHSQLVDTDMTQTGTQRMFGCGTIYIRGIGVAGHSWVNVKSPLETKKMLDEMISKHGGKRAPPPPPPDDGKRPPPPPDDDDDRPRKRTRCPSCGAPIPRSKRDLDHCEYCGMTY